MRQVVELGLVAAGGGGAGATVAEVAAWLAGDGGAGTTVAELTSSLAGGGGVDDGRDGGRLGEVNKSGRGGRDGGGPFRRRARGSPKTESSHPDYPNTQPVHRDPFVF
jgi:hypothetical protein